MKQKKLIFSLINYIIAFFAFLSPFFCVAQSQRIELGKSRIALNEPFTISIESDGKEIEEFSSFPEIVGFKKISSPSYATSRSNFSDNNDEKRNITTYIRTQTYHPIREGTFILRPFKIRINNKEVDSEGLTIIVGAYDKRKGDLEDFTSDDLLDKNEIKLIDVREDAFLGLTVDKTEVLVGEGFGLVLALYVAAENQAPMEYLDLGKQIEEIAKQLKPSNCWEENFNIREVPEPLGIQINGKTYFQYKFYEAIFYPFNNQLIRFPRVGLKIKVKKKIDLKNPNEFNEKSETEVKTFYTNARTISVKKLPIHPLQDKVVVGSFYLQENYPSQALYTGESFKYTFQIIGEGNISALSAPLIKSNAIFEIYSPNSQQFINRGQGKVSGTMIFEYQIVPKEAGNYRMADYFTWIYFNLNTGKYDTLHSQTQLKISGESLRNNEIMAANFDKFYQRINKENNTLLTLDRQGLGKIITQVLLFLILLGVLVLTFWNKT